MQTRQQEEAVTALKDKSLRTKSPMGLSLRLTNSVELGFLCQEFETCSVFP